MHNHKLTALSMLVMPLLTSSLWADIVINEIHLDPEPKTEPVEFIELHNTGASAVDLSSWQFTKGVAFSFPASTSIPAGGYLVISENPTEFATKFGGSSLGPWTGKLSNEGEEIVLKDSQGVKQDSVDYGVGFPWPLASKGTGLSMELIHPSLDNDIGASWRASGDPAACEGSGGSTNFIEYVSTGWKYFKGTTDPATDTNGKTWWQHADYIDTAWLPSSGIIGYGESFIETNLPDMRQTTTPANAGYSTVFLRKTFTVLDKTLITDLLFRARMDDGVKVWINGTPVYDRLAPDSAATPSSYSSVSTGNSGSETEQIIHFTSPVPNTYLVDGTNVLTVQLFNASIGGSGDCFFGCELEEYLNSGTTGSGPSQPSPNSQNNTFLPNSPPAVRQVEHTPETPTAGQDVIITAKITDADGVASAVLHYQTVTAGGYIRRGDAAYEDVSNWVNLTMVDDGTNGDATSGDSIYSVTIPGSTQVNRSLIRYRITVTDSLNYCMRLPYGDDTQPNFAYFCYNGVPSWDGKIDSSSSTVTYTSAELTRVPVYHLIADNTDVENSQWNNGYAEVYFEGTLIYDGKVYDHMRFRNKGAYSIYWTGHNKWKLNFNRGHRFQARTYYGKKFGAVWDRFSIQTGESPWWKGNTGLSGMLFQESLMARISNLSGVPTPEMVHFHFRVIDDASESNGSDQYDGDFWGIYTAQQHPDKSFFDQNNLPSSNLYKVGDTSKWNQSSTQVDDDSDLSSFISGYQSTNDINWWSANLARDKYYTWNALNLALNNSDLRPEANIIYWHNSDTNLWHISVWDVDLLFEPGTHNGNWENIDRILSHSVYEIEYQNRVRELQDLLFENGQYGRNIDEIVELLTGNSSGAASNTLVDANRAQWHKHPHKSNTDWWYRHSYQSYLSDTDSYWSDFAEMATYMKNFAKISGYGGGQLNTSSGATSDSLIPVKPTISYTGTAGYPTSDISLQTNAFSDSTGSVASIQWRIGEIYYPTVSNYVTGEPRKYEITPVWESGELAWNGSSTTMDVPVASMKVGRTYRARVRHKDDTGRWSRWSEPHEFLTAAPNIADYQNSLVVTEIHYNPLAPSTPTELGASLDEDDFEFIELMNVGAAAIDLNGVRIADAIDFDFEGSAITTLAPGARVLVVKHTAAFEARYGTGFPLAGEYSGKLSNKGELVRLAYGAGNTAGNLIRSFTYDDKDPWAEEPDGDGPSLVLIDPWSLPDHDVSTSWRASHVTGGQPGEVDSWNYTAWRASYGISPALPDDDPDNDGLGHLAEYFLGTDPLQANFDTVPSATMETINPGGGSAEYFVLTFQHNLNADDIVLLVQESTDLDQWNTGGAPVLIDAVPLSTGLETLRYRSNQPLSSYANNRLFMRLNLSEAP